MIWGKIWGKMCVAISDGAVMMGTAVAGRDLTKLNDHGGSLLFHSQ